MWLRGYMPGDILTACDNELNIAAGYLGHAAIVIDSSFIMESVIAFPHIQIVSIDNFLHIHPKHAHYRPRDPALGSAAVAFAMAYFQTARRNYSQGIYIPKFSFSDAIPLEDMWGSIYCSKLIWLSYKYGANYELHNDHYLFSPEDIDRALRDDMNFQLLYKHPEFLFLIDT
jgi:hypothetical protein